MALKLDRTAQVWGITGNLGGGKTLSAVYLSVNAMRQGFFVCSNVTFDLDRICFEYGNHLRKLYKHISLDDPSFDPFALPCGSPRGSGGKKRVLVVLDECAEWVDQYSNAKDPRIQRLWSWLRHSSKRSQDVLLIVQRPDYLNKVLRLLVSRWLIIDDLAVWRMPILRMRLPFCGGFVMQRVFDRCNRLVQSPCFCNKSLWGRFYNTSECLNSDGATYNSEYFQPRKSVPFPWICALVWILSLLLGCRAGPLPLHAVRGEGGGPALGYVCISAQVPKQ